tara:strand:- start:5207 stop:5728 length:522 start_codon:yes stop_codon:yes gene_type:complete
MMEDQVPSSKQYVTPGQVPKENNYYVNPSGPRYNNPAEFDRASSEQPMSTQSTQFEKPEINFNVPDFEAMRKEALKQAIEQVTQQPAPQQVPPRMEFSMNGSEYIPQTYPNNTPQVNYVPQEQFNEEVRVVRRNLTLAELILIFAVATGSVLGVQAIWAFTTDFLPRIEIRAK